MIHCSGILLILPGQIHCLSNVYFQLCCDSLDKAPFKRKRASIVSFVETYRMKLRHSCLLVMQAQATLTYLLWQPLIYNAS